MRVCIESSQGGVQKEMAVRGFRVNWCSVVAAVGFGLTLVWCMLMSHTRGFVSDFDSNVPLNARIFYLLGILSLALAYVAAPRALKRADRALRYVLPLLSVLGTSCFGLAYRQTFFDSVALAVCGLLMVGVGFFWFLSRYILMLARTQGFACAVWTIAAGLVIKLPIIAAFNLLANPDLQVAVAMALPIVSALVFELACSLARKEARHADGAGAAEPARTVYGVPAKPRIASPTSRTFKRNTLILMAVSAILLAVIRSVSNLGLWGAATSSAWLMGFVVPAAFLIAFAYFALIRMADFTLTMRFQPAILLVMVGLFVVALQASPDSDSLPFLTDVIQIDELCAHLLFWTVAVTALDALDMPSYRVIGMLEAVFAAASIAWILLLGSADIVNNIYVLLATYLVVTAAMYGTWLGGRRRSDEEAATRSAAGQRDVGGPGGTSAGSALARTVTDTCSEIAERYALSPRETEVFLLLAQGRTRAFIQDELVLSGSTVKTHVSHIYAKMDVHDRQEMMDLIWS